MNLREGEGEEKPDRGWPPRERSPNLNLGFRMKKNEEMVKGVREAGLEENVRKEAADQGAP